MSSSVWDFGIGLLNLFKTKKWGIILGIIACLGVISGAAYGQVKLDENTKKITQLEKNQRDIVSTLRVMHITLMNVGKSVDDVKKVVDKIDTRVFNLVKKQGS